MGRTPPYNREGKGFESWIIVTLTELPPPPTISGHVESKELGCYYSITRSQCQWPIHLHATVQYTRSYPDLSGI